MPMISQNFYNIYKLYVKLKLEGSAISRSTLMWSWKDYKLENSWNLHELFSFSKLKLIRDFLVEPLRGKICSAFPRLSF